MKETLRECKTIKIPYHAGGFLNTTLDFEGCCTNVFKSNQLVTACQAGSAAWLRDAGKGLPK